MIRVATVALCLGVCLAGVARAEPAVTGERAAAVLFGDHPPRACSLFAEADRIRCLIASRYGASPRLLRAALRLYDEMGDVVGVEAEHDMDGGYRGDLHIVPALATEEHLRWILAAQRDYEQVLAALTARAGHPLPYRHRALVWRTFRTKQRSPSAYAEGWEIGYNVVGSLLRSAADTRDVIFHEVFHLNDEVDEYWSARALGGIYRAIVEKCGAKPSCYDAYAPSSVKVARTGMYYAFQQDNGAGVGEYAAELCARFLAEQLAVVQKRRWPGASFKCGVAEDALVWQRLSEMYFGGANLTPPCR